MRKNHTSSDATLKWQQCIKFESLESLDNNLLDILSIFKKFVVKYKLGRYQINIRTFLRFLLIAQTMGVCTHLLTNRKYYCSIITMLPQKKKTAWKKAATTNLVAGRLVIAEKKRSLLEAAEMQLKKEATQAKLAAAVEELEIIVRNQADQIQTLKRERDERENIGNCVQKALPKKSRNTPDYYELHSRQQSRRRQELYRLAMQSGLAKSDEGYYHLIKGSLPKTDKTVLRK